MTRKMVTKGLQRVPNSLIWGKSKNNIEKSHPENLRIKTSEKFCQKYCMKTFERRAMMSILFVEYQSDL